MGKKHQDWMVKDVSNGLIRVLAHRGHEETIAGACHVDEASFKQLVCDARATIEHMVEDFLFGGGNVPVKRDGN